MSRFNVQSQSLMSLVIAFDVLLSMLACTPSVPRTAMTRVLCIAAAVIACAAAACPTDRGTCNCDWANPSTCGTDDSTECYCRCCCAMSGSCKWNGGVPPAPSPPPPPRPPPSPTPTGFTAKTTRYWDCCKPSCAWPDNAGVGVDTDSSVRVCARNGSTADPNTKSICGGGGLENNEVAYMCSDNQPWAVSDTLAYGFAAANIDCSTCYELEFLAGPLAAAGKRMVVQVTNSGGDLGEKHFDIQLPGGGFGIFNGCAKADGEPVNGPAQFDVGYDAWGQRYGGIGSLAECASLPQELQPGCEFRFGWFENADNPDAQARRVRCPDEIVAYTGSRRRDDDNYAEVKKGGKY